MSVFFRVSRAFMVRRLSTTAEKAVAASRPRREDFYSQDEFFGRIDPNQRPYPPALSDDEYMYDVALDSFDLEHIEQESQLASLFQGDRLVQSSPMTSPKAKSQEPAAPPPGAAPLFAPLPSGPPSPPLPKVEATPPLFAPSPGELSPVSLATLQVPIDDSRNDPVPSAVTNQITQTRLIVNREAPLPSTHVHAGQLDEGFPNVASYGNGATTSLDILEKELEQVAQSIYQENNGVEFNINSVKKTSLALFGREDQSTNKDRLEGMAGGGNRMAGLILKYRALKNRIQKLARYAQNKEQGTEVKSALGVKRVVNHTWTVEDMTDPLVLLDASAYIFRAYYTSPAIHRAGDALPVGAVMGFCRMLNKLLLGSMLKGDQPRFVLCFDARGQNFRHGIFGNYKGNRPAAPVDLIPQFDLVRQAAEAYGLCQIEAPSFEADDVIATLASMAIDEGIDTNILSGDKDLMQLVTGLDVTPSVQLIDPKENYRTTYSEVVEKWGVGPEKLGDLLALAGDSADNVPGVKGIGPKTAAKLINEYGDLTTLLESIDSIKQAAIRKKLQADKNNARMSRKLVALNCSVPMDQMTGFPEGVTRVSDLRMELVDPGRILKFYDDMGFRQIKREFESKLNNVKAKRSPSKRQEKVVEIPTPDEYSDVPF